jgi:hypothetical protein
MSMGATAVTADDDGDEGAGVRVVKHGQRVRAPQFDSMICPETLRLQ